MCFNTGVINTGCPHLTSRALHNFRRALTMAALKWQRREGKAEHGRYCINCTPNPAVGCIEEKIWFWRVSLWRRRGCWYWAHTIPHMVHSSTTGAGTTLGTIAVPDLPGTFTSSPAEPMAPGLPSCSWTCELALSQELWNAISLHRHLVSGFREFVLFSWGHCRGPREVTCLKKLGKGPCVPRFNHKHILLFELLAVLFSHAALQCQLEVCSEVPSLPLTVLVSVTPCSLRHPCRLFG